MRHGPPEVLISYAVNNFNDAYLNNGTYYDERNIEKNRTFHLDILKEYGLGETISGSFKFGGKYRVLNRSKNTNGSIAPYYNMSWPQYEILSNGSVVKKDLSGTDFENLKLVGSGHVSLSNFLGSNIETRNLFDLYSLNPLIDVNLIKEWYQLNKSGSLDLNGRNPEYRKDAQSVLNYYELTERIGAGYIMNTLRFSDFVTLITGLRAENESNDYKSRYTPGDLNSSVYIPSSIKDTSSNFNELIWLPNFQLKIMPTGFMNIRLAAYRALARPDFNYRLLKYVGQSGTHPTVILGNPNLKAAKAWNYETSISLYNNEIGLFTISGFYKVIKDMYKQTNNIQLQINQGADAVLEQLGITWPIAFPRYGLTYAYNSPKVTKVWGFELSHQINFLYLPGFLSGIVLSYNVSISRSESYNIQTEVITTGVFPNRKTVRIIVQDKGKLESQPELFGNVALGYDMDGFSGRVSVFFQNEYITSITGDGRDTHFQKGFTNWDLALKQRINKNIAVLFNINNFSDYIESSGIRNNVFGWEQINNQTKYGLTADLGIRITL